ncbi:MAG TPA: IPT/TIG domain-containing protein [Candidatus Methylomirabilis sp.]|nr:IPT/TIG domain-containing protein [Candidatus Methylomirabilis sp.]
MMAHESRLISVTSRVLRWVLVTVVWLGFGPMASAAAANVSLTPDKGPTAGGTRVLIEIDDGLTLGRIQVDFGGRSAPVVRGLGVSIIEVIAPPGKPGPVPVHVVYGLLSKTTASAVFQYMSPSPRLTRLDPSVALTGSQDLTLSLEGEDFSTTCGVRVGDTQVPTTLVSPQRLQAQVPSSLLASTGMLQVRVIDTAVAGNASGIASLSVVNPSPQLTAVEAPPLRVSGPAAPLANSPGPATVTVRGRGFRRESVIQLAGIPAQTQFHSDEVLTATIPAELLVKPRDLPIVVVTPGPGGGSSHPLSVSVVAPYPGRFLVFTSNRHSQRNHIFLLDRQVGRVDSLEEANSKNAEDSYPSISADGRFIVFQSNRRGGQFHVFLFDRETHSLDPLPELNHPTAFDGFPHISADGRFIVFESDRLGGRPKIFLFDRQMRTLSELSQANEAGADDGLAAISN